MNIEMRKIIILTGLVLSSFAAGAQTYYQDARNPEMLRPAEVPEAGRKEIILPDVNGCKVLKADLHTHTIFSDGQVLPNYRVNEAWQDGLDVMAVTEHIEHRPVETTMVEYTAKYNSGNKAINNTCVSKPVDENGIMVDLNYSVRKSQAAAVKYGMLIIPGSEVTRSGNKVGHFNALFTTDNNLIYDPDPVQAVRNAKAQGALVMHNHPGWTKTSIGFTPTEETLYKEGLIDGVEAFNSDEFYPGIIDRAQEHQLFIAASSDIHGSTSADYRILGQNRPMTLIFAKEKTLDSVREALEAGRTLAYGFETVCGEEQLLKDFFASGMKVAVMRSSNKGVDLAVTNMTSIPYIVRQGETNQKRFMPFHTLWFRVPADAKTLDLTVLNMYSSKDGHPVVSLGF